MPGDPGQARVAARAALLALNVGSLVAAIPVIDALDRVGGEYISYRDASMYVDQSGLRLQGRRICNIQPFDADGRPLEGVQLFDQGGDRITTSCTTWDEGSSTQHYPWESDGQDRWNVFPQPERAGDGRVKADAWESGTPPRLPQPASLRVPPVALPTSVTKETTKAERVETPGTTGKGDRRGSTPKGEAGRGDHARDRDRR